MPPLRRTPADWPLSGRVPGRTQYLPARRLPLDPPLREAWSLDTHAPIEGQPAIGDDVAYVAYKYGLLRAVDLRTHRMLWILRYSSGKPHRRPDPAPPVYHDGRLFVAFQFGRLAAFDPLTGGEEWKREYSHLEFSPLVVGGTVYAGADESKMVAVRASNGESLWQYDAGTGQQLSASPSYGEGRLYFPTFKGPMLCLDAASGKLLWRTETHRLPHFGEGAIRASAAIAFGRVYVSRSDGTIVALDARSGRIDWVRRIGSVVENAPAVARVPGTPPTVYMGSEDGYFYALNALTGKVEWRFRVGGEVPGTPTVIGHTVYAQDYARDQTIGIDVRSHKETFGMPKVNRPVSDGRYLYVVGHGRVIALQPKR